VKQIRLQTLRGDLEAAQIKDEEKIYDYYSQLLLIVNKIRRKREDGGHLSDREIAPIHNIKV